MKRKISLNYFFYELRKVLFSKTTLMVYILSFVLLYIGGLDLASVTDKSFTCGMEVFLDSVMDGISCYYVVLFPLMVSLPYALTYANERDNGYTNIILSKISRKSYLFQKIIINAIVVSIIIFSSLVIWYKHCMSMFEGYVYSDPQNLYNNLGLFYNTYFDYGEDYYALAIIISVMLLGVIYSTLCMGFSNIVKNKFIAFIMPFAYYLFSGIFLIKISSKLYTGFLFETTCLDHGKSDLRDVILYDMILMIIGIVLLFKGEKNE